MSRFILQLAPFVLAPLAPFRGAGEKNTLVSLATITSPLAPLPAFLLSLAA